MKLKRYALISLSISLGLSCLGFGILPSEAQTKKPHPVGKHPVSVTSMARNPVSRINPDNKPPFRAENPMQLAMTLPNLRPQTPRLDQSIILKAGVKSYKESIDLTVDKAELINLKAPISRVSISQSAIANVTMINPHQIQLLGKRIGVANLLIWPTNGGSAYTSVDIVVHRDVSALTRQLHAIDPNLQVVPMAAEDTVILTGHVNTVEASQLAVQLAKAFFSQGGKSTSGQQVGQFMAALSSSANAGSNKSNGGNANKDSGNSQTPGSAIPTASTNVINLIQVAGQPSTKLEMARIHLKQIDPNINLEIIPGPDGGEKAVLTGTVQNPAQISEAVNTASVFYGQLGMKVIAGPGGNTVRPTGSGDFHTSEAFSDNGDVNMLQGTVVTDATGNVVCMLKLAHKPQVKCTIRFLDISRRDVNQLGATLTGQSGNFGYGHFTGAQSAARTFSSISGTGTNSGTSTGWLNGSTGSEVANGLVQRLGNGTTQLITLNQNMAMALSAFIETNKIKTLAEPTLLMLSGEKASFMAGGEFPIPISGYNGQITVTFKQFGIRLNIIPTVTENNKINLQVAPEVSAIDPANSIIANGISIPGIRTRRMQTTLEVQPNQSLVLAGLFNQEEADMASRFPGIGDLPVVGAFFRQKNRNKLNNEMMVVITPQVIYEENASQAAISSDAKQLFDNSGNRKTTSYKP